jgi:hypothetical protein
MTRKSLLSAAVVATLATGAGVPAMSHDDDNRHHGRRRLKAELSGFNEAPNTLSTAAHGSFRAVLQKGETEIRYRLDYSGLEGTVTQAHIHLGAHHQAGGISVWLCQTATNPAPGAQALVVPMCGDPGGDDAEAEGVLTAASVIGPTGQGIAAGQFEELVRAIKSGVTYANVHSSLYPSGEIRGQIKLDD